MKGKLIKWSDEQIVIIDKIKFSEKNLLIRSVAGSGKTAVLVASAGGVKGKCMFLAFNKKIVLELEERLPSGFPVKTFHALCFQFLKDRLAKGLKVDGYKNLNIIKKHFPEMEEAKWEISRLVGLLKNLGVGIIEPATREFVEEVRENYDVTCEGFENSELVYVALKVLKRGAKDIKVIDFDDMLYISLKLVVEQGWEFDKYDVVFLDEAQDTNAVQLHLLESMAERVIAVGDDFQAIYGFRGAGSNSMPLIGEMFDCESLPMNTSWRCPAKVAEIARRIVPQFMEAPDAPEGFVDYVDRDSMHLGYVAGNLYLCRMNYPLFEVAMDLLKRRIAFSMSGKFPEQLKRFVNSFAVVSCAEFRAKLGEWWVKKEAELLAKNKMGLIEREFDKYQCLLSLLKESVDVRDLIWKLELMMECKTGVRLSTIHGAKGLEADTVVIIAPELMPSKYAVTEEQLQQERNLQYVAETRAISNLIYCKFD